MPTNKNKISLIIVAFGFMGSSTLKSFYQNKFFEIKGIIIPVDNKYYYSEINIEQLKKKVPILSSDDKTKVHNFIKKLKPDIVVISTYNKIFDKKTLELSHFINIHHGKLPKQKGRASINWALIMGRKSIYLTIHQAIPKLDSGKIIKQKEFKISDIDNYQSIKKKICIFLKKDISNIIYEYLNNKVKLKNNNQSKETWNCSRNPEDGMINFFDKRQIILNLIKASDGEKFGAYCFLKEKKIVVLEANIKSKKKFEGIIPGRIVKLNSNGSIECLCKDGILTITKISYKKRIYKPKQIIKSTRFTLLND